jgi:hypothetical protein
VALRKNQDDEGNSCITIDFMNMLEKLTLFRAQPTKSEASGRTREAKVSLFSIYLAQFT